MNSIIMVITNGENGFGQLLKKNCWRLNHPPKPFYSTRLHAAYSDFLHFLYTAQLLPSPLQIITDETGRHPDPPQQ